MNVPHKVSGEKWFGVLPILVVAALVSAITAVLYNVNGSIKIWHSKAHQVSSHTHGNCNNITVKNDETIVNFDDYVYYGNLFSIIQ